MARRDLMDGVLSTSNEPPGPLTDKGDAAVAAGKTDITPESSGDDLLDAPGDDVSRSMLLTCNHAPIITEELAESHEVSESTTYRRLEVLSNPGLVERTQQVDMSSKTCYETAVDGLLIHLNDGPHVEAGSSDHVVDAMCTLLTTIDVQQPAYNREQNSVDVRFRLVLALLDSLVELYVGGTDSRGK